MQILLLLIVEALGNGFAVIMTLLDLDPQAFELVSVTVYVVVIVGETFGLEEVELKPAGELIHVYVLFVTAVAPIEIEIPEQIAVSCIVAAAGEGLTFTTTESVLLHPFERFTSVRV